MTHDSALVTSIAEPSQDAGEAEMLLFALDRSRATFAWKCGGLDSEGLQRQQPPSVLTLGKLLKHMAFVDDWTTTRAAGTAMPKPWTEVDWDNDADWPWTSAADDSPEELYALWRRAAERSKTEIAALLAAGGLDQRSRFGFEPDDQLPIVRRLLVDLHEEYARHVGHADLLREAVDGLVGEDPPQG